MTAEWFCNISGKTVGPLSAQQLKALVKQGKLKAEHQVRQGSNGMWVPANRVKGLFADSPPRTESVGSNEIPVAKPAEKSPKKPLAGAAGKAPPPNSSACAHAGHAGKD